MTENDVQGKTWKKTGGVLGDSIELAFLSSDTDRAWGYVKTDSGLFLLKREVPEGVAFSEPLAVDQVVPAVEGWLDSVDAVSQEVFFGSLRVEGLADGSLFVQVVPLYELVTEEPGRVVEVF